jgi:superoxide dismutase, Fe-Mn family
MDVWEHAFMLDYGVKRDGYIDAFLKAIDWRQVNSRFEAASREPALV